MRQSGAQQQWRGVDCATRNNERSSAHLNRVRNACVRIGHHGFEADRSPIFDDQAVSLAIRNDACVATLRLSVAEERYNRALFATVTAAQDAKTALSGIAVARVTLNRSESVAERRAAAGDDVVIRVHHAFVAGYIDA